MRSSSSAFRFALWLSVGAILVMGAAPKKQQDDFNDERFDEEGGNQNSQVSKGGGSQINGNENSRSGASSSSSAAAAASSSSSSSAPSIKGGNLFSQMSNGITGIIGGVEGLGSGGGSSAASSAVAASAAAATLGGPVATVAKSAVETVGSGSVYGGQIGSGGSGSKGELTPPKNSIQDWGKLLLNPIELTKHISEHFNIPLDKLIEKIGSSCVYGLEALLQPFVACIKIIEKVFQPDNCRLKLVCKLTGHLHFLQDKLLKLSPAFYESSVHLKAMSSGLAGKDCELVYPNCGEPTLNKPFAELKDIKDYKGGARGLSRQPAAQAYSETGSNKQVAAATGGAHKAL